MKVYTSIQYYNYVFRHFVTFDYSILNASENLLLIMKYLQQFNMSSTERRDLLSSQFSLWILVLLSLPSLVKP